MKKQNIFILILLLAVVLAVISGCEESGGPAITINTEIELQDFQADLNNSDWRKNLSLDEWKTISEFDRSILTKDKLDNFQEIIVKLLCNRK